MGVAEYLLSFKAPERFVRVALILFVVIEIALLALIFASSIRLDDDKFLYPLALHSIYLFTPPLILAIIFGAKRDPYIYYVTLHGQWAVFILNLGSAIWRTFLLPSVSATTSTEAVLFFSGWVSTLAAYLTMTLLSIGSAVLSRRFNRAEYQLKQASGGYLQYDKWNRLSRPLYWSIAISTGFVMIIFWTVIAILVLSFLGFFFTESYFWWVFLYLFEFPMLVTTLLAAGDISKYPSTGTQMEGYILFAALLRTFVLVSSSLATGIRISLSVSEAASTDTVTWVLVWIQNTLGIFLFFMGLIQVASLFSQFTFFGRHLIQKLRGLRLRVKNLTTNEGVHLKEL